VPLFLLSFSNYNNNNNKSEKLEIMHFIGKKPINLCEFQERPEDFPFIYTSVNSGTAYQAHLAHGDFNPTIDICFGLPPL
jgi:hypothetical protein